ncbi:glycosyltransferase family 8 protein [Ruminococcus sp.]|uniref:glycosyltransferase family 8 protein n=1 Tax=Ruminococcus sp. TaxID=41978 RepID=UPI003EFEF192
MNIVYSSSDSFSPVAGVSITSLLCNNKDTDEINIYLIDNDISEENKKKFVELTEKFGRNLVFIPKPDLNKQAGIQINVGRWNISTFFRLFLCTILPDDIDRCIFLDCDTVIRHSLKELWEMDLEGKIVGSADDCRSDRYKTELGLSPDSTYTNNGVMLIDLKAWREMNVEKDFLEFIVARNGDITYVDQGVLNGVLAKKNLVKVIHTKYDAMTIFFDFNFKDLMKVRRPEHHLSEQEYNETVTDPYIIHYTSCFLSGTRPWNEKNNHPFVGDFLKYKEMSPWKGFPPYPDDRKKSKKLMTTVCNIMPKGLMIATISLVHSKLYPMIRSLKSRGKK